MQLWPLFCYPFPLATITLSCFVPQRLISERDTLRETNDELRCAQVQQRFLSGAGES